MRKSKFNESQIVGILKEAESGVPVAAGWPTRATRLARIRCSSDPIRAWNPAGGSSRIASCHG